jgi:CO/xanthine dehydrogenase FAD-binding subunit
MWSRPSLPSFDYVRATSREHVVELLRQQGKDVRLLSGGTDLLVRMRDGFFQPKVVLDVKHLPGMQEIVFDPRTGLTVGAAVAMNRVAHHPDVLTHYPLLAEAANSVASYQIRNRATVGGNLCNCSPAADTAPAILVLEGRLVLFGPGGEREVPAEEFFLGPGKSAMAAAEFMTGMRLPVLPPGGVGRYLKLGRNKAGDLAIVSVAVYGFPRKSNPSGYGFRIALGSVAPIPLRAAAAEAVLASEPPGASCFARAAQEAMAAASPIDDVRASAAYRRAMVHNLTEQALSEVWQELGG